MPITSSPVERVFQHGSLQLGDPDPTMTPEQVRDMYSTQYPSLSNSAIESTVENGKRVFTFKRSIGKKG